MPTATDYGLDYLGSFYGTGLSFPAEQTVGATYKGFNDTLAAWGSQRVMNQQCGETWLQTFSKLNSIYSSGKQLSDLQLVTWNDYEEATELESGIDNCLSVSASTSANALQWALHGNGNENTVDHYTIYISSDGQNLMPLADMQTGVYSLNLCSFGVPAGSYKLHVQAVGKPSLANQISGAVNYSPSCDPAQQSIFSVSATPSTVTMPTGKNGSLTVTVNPNSGPFNNLVSLSCLGLPATLACSFSPANVTPGPNPVASKLTISPVAATSMTLPGRREGLLLYGTWLLPFGIAGITFVGGRPCRSRLPVLAVGAILAIGMVTISCGAVAKPGGVSATAAGNKATHFAVTVQGASGSNRSSTIVNLVIQ
jgi:hypothetical protein